MSLPDQRNADYLDVLRTAIDALSNPPLPFCLIGALALGAHGKPRATYDIDLLILAEHETCEAYLAAVHRHGFEVSEKWRDANPMARNVVVRLHHAVVPDCPLDFIFATSPLHQSALNRRSIVTLGTIQVPVCSPEDLILLKLLASRPRDFDDVMGIIGKPATRLDLDYLWSWAEHLGLQSELHYVLISAKP
jgi:Nucleotidyl transferase of unknown function (DUF2204)